MFNLVTSSSPSVAIEASHATQYEPAAAEFNPTCIVIGCKNGEGVSNPNTKYYPVPSAQQIARQWYINTLREDLFDSLQQQQRVSISSSVIPQHHVCIEHFDEECFVNAPVVNEQGAYEQMSQIKLNEDAVPSLFEIEIFQKMIAHTEQINQLQLQQQQSLNLLQQSQGADINTSNASYQADLFEQSKQQVQSPNSTGSASSKRSRMDPDLRATLIQRVPKALKRTTVYASEALASNSRLPKAVKHTMPRSVLQPTTNTAMISSSSTSSILSEAIKMSVLEDNVAAAVAAAKTSKTHKAVKHTTSLISSSATAFLKGMYFTQPSLQIYLVTLKF
jgi:hypothetical protein